MYKKVPLNEVRPDPSQPRQEFDPSELLRLKDSISAHGIINPLIVEKVEKGYLVIDGERRYRAAKALNFKEIPVIVLDNKLSDEDRLAKRFHLQEQHASWTAFDKARAIQEYQLRTGMQYRELANFLGVNLATVSDYLQLINLSQRTKEIGVNKRIPLSYLVNIGKTIKGVEKIDDARRLETAILDKIESGLITNYHAIDCYNRAINHAGVKIIKNIIKIKDYSPAQATKDAKMDGLINYKNVMIQVRYMLGNLSKAMATKGFNYLTMTDVKNINKLKKSLDVFVEAAGNIDD